MFPSSLSLYASPYRLQTALHKAAWFGYKDICKILIEKGASPRRTDYQYNTPYDKAIQSDDMELQQYLKRKLCCFCYKCICCMLNTLKRLGSLGTRLPLRSVPVGFGCKQSTFDHKALHPLCCIKFAWALDDWELMHRNTSLNNPRDWLL